MTPDFTTLIEYTKALREHQKELQREARASSVRGIRALEYALADAIAPSLLRGMPKLGSKHGVRVRHPISLCSDGRLWTLHGNTWRPTTDAEFYAEDIQRFGETVLDVLTRHFEASKGVGDTYGRLAAFAKQVEATFAR